MFEIIKNLETKTLINAGGIIIALMVLYFLMNNVQAGIQNLNQSIQETNKETNDTILKITQDQSAALLQLSKVIEANTEVMRSLRTKL